jgi:hypothetical protein
MMLSLMTALALAGTDLPAEPAPAPDIDTLSETGESMMLAQVCRNLGYEVDQPGHAAWVRQQRDAMIAAEPRLTAEAADAAIIRNARTQYMRMYRTYWAESMFVRGINEWDSARMTFVNLYRKNCKRWASSPEMERIVTAPAQRVPASQVVSNTRAQFRLAGLDP